jgi:hypothetical protein
MEVTTPHEKRCLMTRYVILLPGDESAWPRAGDAERAATYAGTAGSSTCCRSAAAG